MKNKYFVYAVINILIFIAYIYSTYFYFLVIWAISILFPLMLFILLKLEARYTQLDLHGQKQGEVGKRLSFVSEITSQYRLLVSGRIEYDFVYENNTLQSQIRRRIFIPLGMKYSKKEHQYTATYCGEVTFSYENIYLYDVFGFCRVSFPQDKKHHVVIYPHKIPMELLYNELSKPYENGLLQYQYKKGPDMSEIFDLKQYYQGDDIRHVHWKLTAKTRQMLLKEGTHNSSFETVLLVDIGLNDQNEEVDKKVLSKALSFAMSMSEELLLKNIGHYVALYDHGSFYWLEMNNVQDYYTALEQWFYKGVSLQNGDALHLFMSEQLDLIFTKMIYVTAGNFNEEISKLNDFLSVSAITVKDHLEKVQTTKHHQNQLYELPVDLIDENTYRFEI